jgi:microcystin-dependent protein
MSTVKVNELKHLSNTGSANIVLESNATTNLQATSTLGLTVTGTLTVSGVSTLNGNTVVGNASSDTMVLTSTVSGFNNFSGFTGEIRMYAGNAAGDSSPAGWLYCNGDTISSTINDGGTNLGGTHYNADGKGNDYQPLFNLLKASSDWGNTSSASWGTDKVKVPDFRSRSPIGMATGAANAADARTTGTALAAGLTSRTLSDTAGTETHVLITAELAAHTHTSTIVASVAGQTPTYTRPTATQDGHTHTLVHTHDVNPPNTTTSTIGTHTHTLQSSTSSWAGGGSYGSTGTHIGNAQTAPQSSGGGSHSHTLDIGNFTSAGASATTTSGASASGVTLSGGSVTLSNPTHTHTLTAASTGSGTAHTNLSPIIAVNYIIKV